MVLHGFRYLLSYGAVFAPVQVCFLPKIAPLLQVCYCFCMFVAWQRNIRSETQVKWQRAYLYIVQKQNCAVVTQWGSMVFISVWKDKFSDVTWRCSVGSHCHAGQMADCSALLAHRMSNFVSSYVCFGREFSGNLIFLEISGNIS